MKTIKELILDHIELLLCLVISESVVMAVLGNY